MSRSGGCDVLVGVDGSAPAERALRWAAEEARLRRMPLTVCHAWQWPYPDPPSGPAALESVRREGRRILDTAVVIARETAPRIHVSGLLGAGPAPAVLLDQSRHASLVLIGTRGSDDGGPSASPSAQVPAYAGCPVIIVRGAADRGRPVVVGVDGSLASEAALAFGFEEAALRGQPLVAIYGSWEPVPSGAPGLSLREKAGDLLERTVAPWREKYPYVDARISLVRRPTERALLETAAGAGLLVLGGRGLGGGAGLRLGAVGGAILRHAPCSVAVVRPRA